MKKKLSILFAFVMMITMLTGCQVNINTGSSENSNTGSSENSNTENEDNIEIDAAYQLVDVSDYLGAYDVVDPINVVHRALEADDSRIEKAFTYEELAACFKSVKVDINNYMLFENCSIDDKQGKISLYFVNDYYLAKNFTVEYVVNNVSYTAVFDPLENFNGDLLTYDKTDSSTGDWSGAESGNVKITGADYLYQFNPPEGLEVFYVISESENTFGKYILIEEYDNAKFDIIYLLHILDEKGYVKEDGSIKAPVVDRPEINIPESEKPSETPSEKPSETPSQTPESSKKPTFEGTYWLNTYESTIDGVKYTFARGIYLDGNGTFVEVSNRYKGERSYGYVEEVNVSEGRGFLLDGGPLYVLKEDNKLYYEFGDGWSGGIITYSAVSKEEFYKAIEFKHPVEGKYFICADEGVAFGFKETTVVVKNADGTTVEYNYAYDDEYSSVYFENWTMRYPTMNDKEMAVEYGPLPYWTIFAECDKATFDAFK